MAKPTKRIINLLLVTKERDIAYIEFDAMTDANRDILNGYIDRVLVAIPTEREDAIEGVPYVFRGGKITDVSFWVELETMVLEDAKAWLTAIGDTKLVQQGWTFVQSKQSDAYWGLKYTKQI